MPHKLHNKFVTKFIFVIYDKRGSFSFLKFGDANGLVTVIDIRALK